MSPLPVPIISLFTNFAPLCSARVWSHALILLVGAILAPGKRTVTSALRIMGLADERHFINYHRVLSRATWSSLAASRILLGLLVTTLLSAGAPLVVIIDDTLERRRGRKIKACSIFRDAARSSARHTVTSYGLRWVCMTLLVPLPWSTRPWALPFLTCLAPGPSPQRRRHKTCVDWAGQLVRQVRRWHPMRRLVVLVDGGYASLKLASTCHALAQPATLVTRLLLKAQLYDPPPPPDPHRSGKRPLKGRRQRKLSERATAPDTVWIPHRLPWYGGHRRKVWWSSSTALWHHDGYRPLPIRWVLVRDDQGAWPVQAFLCTDLAATPAQIVQWIIQRWNIEVTFEEVRAHLGVETQRQWSDCAIARTTPALLGLFSLVVLLAHQFTRGRALPVRQSAWYAKTEATFADCLAYVRRSVWQQLYIATSRAWTRLALRKAVIPAKLLDALSYSE